MPIQEFRDCQFHDGLVKYIFRYDDNNNKVDAVRCQNNYIIPAYFNVRIGQQIFEDLAQPGTIHEFNIPPGILNQMTLGFDDEQPMIISTTNSNFIIEYRA